MDAHGFLDAFTPFQNTARRPTACTRKCARDGPHTHGDTRGREMRDRQSNDRRPTDLLPPASLSVTHTHAQSLLQACTHAQLDTSRLRIKPRISRQSAGLPLVQSRQCGCKHAVREEEMECAPLPFSPRRVLLDARLGGRHLPATIM